MPSVTLHAPPSTAPIEQISMYGMWHAKHALLPFAAVATEGGSSLLNTLSYVSDDEGRIIGAT